MRRPPKASLICALFLEQSEWVETDLPFGIPAFITEQEQQENVHTLIYPDRRA